MKRTASRLLVVGYLAIVVIAVIFLVWLPFRKYGSRLCNGPMIQNVSTDEFSVVWWNHTTNGAEKLCLRGCGTTDKCFVATREGNRYEARADNLESGITYRYDIVHIRKDGAEKCLYAGQITTAKPSGTPFAFIVSADSGTGERLQHQVIRTMLRYPTDFILYAGDLVYEKGAFKDYYKKFFRPYRNIINNIPFFPVLGNHDVRTDNGKPFLDTFSLPTNGPPSVQAERCYWFDYGNARFVAIDSNLDEDTLLNAVAPWIQEVLKETDATWKFVFFHHAPWAGGGRPSDYKICNTIIPAIEATDVDVVFCGHNHLYERTHPMLNGKTAPTNGIVYITSAAGGKSLHREKNIRSDYLAVFNDTTYSFTWVNIKGQRLELAQISKDDNILDRIVLAKDNYNEIRVAEDK